VNSIVLKELRKKYSDSIDFKKALDIARMDIVNKIIENDTIKTVQIIRIGAKAKDFNAAVVFDTEERAYNNAEVKKVNEDTARKKVAEENRYLKYLEDKKAFLSEKQESQAQKTGTGLRILKLKEMNGRRVLRSHRVTANYTVFTADGKKMKSSKDIGSPTVFDLNDKERPMISGLKEGLLSLREGEKALFFIPYAIGFGNEKFGPFPAKSDLVFEVEILKTNK
jgi:FKBP-type peptidyl-prolyl cis-trans isomerase